ncbi:MAG: hypothetical protein MUC50_06170 [Myxococcota bacterium]|nr:hypothetical protein [Myxococcota bacterium]
MAALLALGVFGWSTASSAQVVPPPQAASETPQALVGTKEQKEEKLNGNLNPQQPVSHPWSVGAGIGLMLYGSPWGMESSLGGLSSSFSLSPFGTVLLEKQLSDQLALTFDVSGTYSHRNKSGEPEGGWYSMNFKHIYGANASVGIRWIFNPGGPVEVSGLASIAGIVTGGKGEYRDSADGADAEDGYVVLDSEFTNYALGGNIGIAFERKLMDHLFLRLQTNLLAASWGSGTEQWEQADGSFRKEKDSLFNIGLAFAPAIQLRLEI